MKTNTGWICIHRSLLEHWLWADKPFARGQAWIDLILMANHQQNSFMFGGSLVTVNRGECLTSVRQLSQRWGWSKDKLYRFLSALEKEGMIHKKSDSKRTLITLLNYGVYQDLLNTSETPTGRKQHDSRPQPDRDPNSSRPLAEPNNNVTMINNETKKNSGCAATPSGGERQGLTSEEERAALIAKLRR